MRRLIRSISLVAAFSVAVIALGKPALACEKHVRGHSGAEAAASESR